MEGESDEQQVSCFTLLTFFLLAFPFQFLVFFSELVSDDGNDDDDDDDDDEDLFEEDNEDSRMNLNIPNQGAFASTANKTGHCEETLHC